MPSGRVHMALNTLALLPIAGAAYLISPEYVPQVLIGYSVSTLFMSPDLDVDFGSRNDYNLGVVFGRWPRRIWRAFWAPYAMLFAHRGMSHWYLIGTIGRYAYIWVMLFLIYRQDLRFEYVCPVLPFFVGSVLADNNHVFADHHFSKLFREEHNSRLDRIRTKE